MEIVENSFESSLRRSDSVFTASLVAEDARREELARMRAADEFRIQSAMRRRHEMITEKLEQIAKMPNTDIDDTKFDEAGRVTQQRKVKGIRPSEIAKLVEVIADLEANMTHGPGVRITKSQRLPDADKAGESGSSEPAELIWSLTEWPAEEPGDPSQG